MVLCGRLADRLESGGRLQKPEPLREGAAPLSFYTDAKAEAGRAWIGGFLELVDGCQGPWFSLEVVESWAPWAFGKGDPGKVIAALGLLATLVGVPQQLVVLGSEVGGRWNAGAHQLVRDLVPVHAQRAPPAVLSKC